MNIIYYLIVFLEWFTTLSVEIIAIREAMSVVWSNTIITSIILWVILLALSYWYYIWWKIASNSSKEKIVKYLFLNLILASIIYTLFSFPFENILLESFLNIWLWYTFSILLSSLLLFFIPVFLASQTIPMVNELIDYDKKSEMIWKLLFFSTIGSFLWSVLTSILFFPTIWVEKTIILNWLLLSILWLIIALKDFKILKEKRVLIALTLSIFYIYFLFINLTLNSNIVYSFSSTHNDIKIVDTKDWENRYMLLSWWYSSWINKFSKNSIFPYINEFVDIIEKEKPKNILIIWWAWFSLPNIASRYDYIDNIDVCDIDETLYEISEKYFLEQKLSEKINFYPLPARYLVNIKEKEFTKYDLIIVDAYKGKIIPSQLLTQEFYNSIKNISNWIITFNFILDKEKKSDFYKKNINTLISSIWEIYSKDTNNKDIWKTNIIISNKKFDWYDNEKYFNNYDIYTDNKWTQEIDKYKFYSN